MKSIQNLALWSTVLTLSGCASALNTAGSGDYGCPGMPSGVLCKTPAAVYKSTHLEPEPTEFDTPIEGPASLQAAKAQVSQDAPKSRAQITAQAAAVPPAAVINPQAAAGKFASGPRPVREPARIARIWIAPWIDKHDNLHLAQTHYTEIKPRTWTVGRPEAVSGGGYVIPYKAYEAIGAQAEAFRPPAHARPAPGASAAPAATSARTAREVEDLEPPPN